jgi:hypothetical protein
VKVSLGPLNSGDQVVVGRLGHRFVQKPIEVPGEFDELVAVVQPERRLVFREDRIEPRTELGLASRRVELGVVVTASAVVVVATVPAL